MTTQATIPHPTTRRTTLSVETLHTDAAFDALAKEWSELAEASTVTVFQTHEWLRSWWTYFAGERRLWIILFRADDTLVGIAPFCIEERRAFGLTLSRHAQCIGRELSDYCDILMRPGYEEAVLDALAQHLTEHSGEWDVLDLDDVPESTYVARHLPERFRARGITVVEQRGNVCPYVTLPERADALVEELGATSRYNFRRKMRNLQSKFRTEIELVRRPEDHLARAVAEFSLIHGERWKSLGYPSAFDNAQHRAFHVEIARRFAERDWLRMFFLTTDGMPVAVTFCFNYRGRIYMYQSNVHGSEAVMKCSPGFLIRSIAMAEGIREGMRVFDFLRGNEKAVDAVFHMGAISDTTEQDAGKLMENNYLFSLGLWEWCAEHNIRFRIGVIFGMISGAFILPVTVVISVQMARVEKGFPLWAILQGITGTIGSMFIWFPVLLWGVATYNGLVRRKNVVAEGWSGIETQLKRRADLIPNLVETTKGYLAHEKGTLEAVIAARNKAVNATGVAATEADQAIEGAARYLTMVLSNALATPTATATTTKPGALLPAVR